MKLPALIAVLYLSVSMAADDKIDRKKDLPDFPNLPTDGPYGGHSRKPDPMRYDQKTRTLRTEVLWPFEHQIPGDESRKFKIDLYQISKDGTSLTRQSLELYPGNRHSLSDKFEEKRMLKPFLFRSTPVCEDGYNMKELEQWLFRKDKTLERIIRETYDRDTDLYRNTIIFEFARDGHLVQYSSTTIMSDDDPLKPLIQKELDDYWQSRDSGEDWKNPVFTKDTLEDGSIQISAHRRKMSQTPPDQLGEGTFHYTVDPENKKLKFIKRD